MCVGKQFFLYTIQRPLLYKRRNLADEKINAAVYRNKKELENSKVGATEKDISIINGMISDINYALEWMRTAKQPGKKEELNVGRHMNVRNHVTHY